MPPPSPAAELTGSKGRSPRVSWRSALPGKITASPVSAGKAAALPCQTALWALKPTTPVASHAFSKQSSHPPISCACWSPSSVLSIAGSKPFAEETEPVSSRNMRACMGYALTSSSQGARRPRAMPVPGIKVSCKALPSLRKHHLGKGPENIPTDAAHSVLAGSNRLFNFISLKWVLSSLTNTSKD